MQAVLALTQAVDLAGVGGAGQIHRDDSPPALRGLPRFDGCDIDACETWAAGEDGGCLSLPAFGKTVSTLAIIEH